MKKKSKNTGPEPDVSAVRKQAYLRYQRYQRNYHYTYYLSIIATIPVFWFVGLFWGFTALAFVIWSFYWYDRGAEDNRTDEYEYDNYPEDGYRWMFKSWPWFVILAAVAYFFCKSDMPWLF